MASQKAILFDLPTKKTQYGCWSPNVWKTRLVLNYKNIPYETKFLLHPQIEPELKAIGIQPNPPKPEDHKGPWPSACTVPAVKLADGTVAMDSAVIAPKIEEKYPEPSLHLETGLHEKAASVLGQIAFPLFGILFPRIGRDVLLDESYPAWKAKREAQFGMSIDEFEKANGGEGAWKAAEPGFKNLSKFLVENKKDEGPFLLGSQVCYGDFVIVAMLESVQRVGEDVYERAVGHDENLRKLHEACKKWCENDR